MQPRWCPDSQMYLDTHVNSTGGAWTGGTLQVVNTATICFMATCSPNIPPSFGQLEGAT